MGLDTLDEFSPKDTDPVSLGDDAIRLTRAATKQSVGLEHYLDGAHKVPGGPVSGRPAAGRAGRLYFNTDLRNAEYDTGLAWSSPADALATACILWHAPAFTVPPNSQPWEVPFDAVLFDPYGYANTAYHQITQPANSVGMVTAYIEFGEGIGGFGAFLSIQQYSNGWANLVQSYAANVQFLNVTTMVDARWGTQLRVVVTNGSGHDMHVNPTPLGSSPRFGYTMLGRTS